MRRRLSIPAPRQLPWPLKPLDTARTSLSYDRFGRMVMQIEHDLVRGLTPKMLAWWFRNIGGEMVIEGRTLNRYLCWHPFDHILWELANTRPGGAVGVGSKFRIVEAFGANPDHYIDIVDNVVRLGEDGITLVGRNLGLQISRLNHDFIATEGGTIYRSTLTIGAAIPVIGRAINTLVHRAVFPEAKGRAWLRHNVEEVGLLEHLVPLIYPGD